MSYTHTFSSDFKFESDNQGIFRPGEVPSLQEKTWTFVDTSFNETILDVGNPTFGGNARVYGNLKFGVTAKYGIDDGSIDSQVFYDSVSLSTPEKFLVSPGENFSFDSAASLSTDNEKTFFQTQSPTAEAGISAFAEVKVGFDASAKAGGYNIFDVDEKLINIEDEFEIIKLSLDGLSLLNGVIETKPSSSALSGSLDVDTLTGKPFAELKAFGQEFFSSQPDQIGPTFNLAEIDLNAFPSYTTKGKVNDDKKLVVDEENIDDEDSEILGLNADIDGILYYTTVLANTAGATSVPPNPFGGSLKLGNDNLTLNYDLLDFDAGPSINLYQDFTLDPELSADVSFSNPVRIDGGSPVSSWSGAWSDFKGLNIAISDTTEIVPTFKLDNKFRSETGIDFKLNVGVEFGKFSLTYDIGPFENSLTLGPFYEDKKDFNIGRLPISTKNFALGGFNTITGDKIVLTVPGSGLNGGIEDGRDYRPEAENDVITISEDGLEDPDITSLIFENDFDPDAYHIKKIHVLDDSTLVGQITVSEDGRNIEYSPNGQFDSLRSGETATETFTYALIDETDKEPNPSDTATVTIEIEGVNDMPASREDELETKADLPVTFSASQLTNNDFDAEGDTLTVVSIDNSTTRGNVSFVNGLITYDPGTVFQDLPAGTTADDSFSYTVSDGEFTDVAQVRVRVFSSKEPQILDLEPQIPDFTQASFGILSSGDASTAEEPETTPPTRLNNLLTNPEVTPDPQSNVRLALDRLEIGQEDFPTTGLVGNDTNDLLLGDETVNAFSGLGGDDTLAGFGEADRLDGNDGNDLIFGNSGNDIINGGAGNDLIFTGKDDDLVTGGDGIDVMMGNFGNDTLDGNAGNDVLFGNSGADVLDGDDGDDVLFGGQDNDIVIGGAGNDVVNGDLGDDLLIGGAGGDRFDFRAGDGINIIADFTDGVDIIGLTEGLTFADVTLTQVGNDTQMTATGLVVTLQNVNVGAIDSADFAVL